MDENLKSKTAALRRNHILQAAAVVFAKRGFRGATIHEVAQAAGVADGTIYNAFANKAELLISLLDPLAENIPPTGDGAPAPKEAAAFVERLFRERWESFTPEMLGILRVVLSEVLVDTDLRERFFSRVISPIFEPLENQLAALAEDGAIATVDPVLAGRALIAMFLGFTLLRLIGDPHLEERGSEALLEGAALVVHGLRPRDGPA